MQAACGPHCEKCLLRSWLTISVSGCGHPPTDWELAALCVSFSTEESSTQLGLHCHRKHFIQKKAARLSFLRSLRPGAPITRWKSRYDSCRHRNPGEKVPCAPAVAILNKNDYRNGKHDCDHFTELFCLFLGLVGIPKVKAATWSHPPGWETGHSRVFRSKGGSGGSCICPSPRVSEAGAHPEQLHISTWWAGSAVSGVRCQVAATALESVLCRRG